MLELQGIGIGNPFMWVLATVVVGVIGCALSYVSTFLTISATAGMASQLAGPVEVLHYAPAEETLDKSVGDSARPIRLD